MHSHRSKLEHLLTKVDSMDNCYDKRLANLEAVVTPLLSNIQPMLSQEIETVLNKRVFPVIGEKMTCVEELENKIRNVEKEVNIVK